LAPRVSSKALTVLSALDADPSVIAINGLRTPIFRSRSRKISHEGLDIEVLQGFFVACPLVQFVGMRGLKAPTVGIANFEEFLIPRHGNELEVLAWLVIGGPNSVIVAIMVSIYKQGMTF